MNAIACPTPRHGAFFTMILGVILLAAALARGDGFVPASMQGAALGEFDHSIGFALDAAGGTSLSDRGTDRANRFAATQTDHRP